LNGLSGLGQWLADLDYEVWSANPMDPADIYVCPLSVTVASPILPQRREQDESVTIFFKVSGLGQRIKRIKTNKDSHPANFQNLT
jgi:hypothetical protein